MKDTIVIDWSTLPLPIDDGAASHLTGQSMPGIVLNSTDGNTVDLSRLSGRVIIYAYPRKKLPDEPPPDGWMAIPGAPGCTPQSCAFRDHASEIKAAGASYIFGLSTQDTPYQKEAVERLHLPYPLLSDEHLSLANALSLPTFTTGGMTLLKRFTMVINDGVIEHVFYPVFPPDQNATEVLAWLKAYSNERATMTTTPLSNTFATPLDLYRAISRVWSGDTSSPAHAWSPSNPAQNHCSVTALVVHDYFGGEILTTRTSGGTHFYNLIDGRKWDLTVSQFAEPVPYDDTASTREAALADTSQEKYALLVSRLKEGR